jgi:hypothetical protein
VDRLIEEDEWQATSIERVEDQENSFSFVGEVTSVDPWSVSEIPLETREWTEIDEDIAVGDRVQVNGEILEDGTWVAASITLLDEEELTTVAFVGVVDEIEPWVIGGIPVDVDEDTVVEEGIEEGDLVLVEALIQEDGSWLATAIQKVAFDEVGLGCFAVTTQVLGVSGSELLVEGWPTIDLDELGESAPDDIAENSVVLLYICVLPDGETTVINIIVIYVPVVEPPDEDEPPAPPEEGDRVTVCHETGNDEHTITIDAAALSAHLDHGDELGACDD